MTQSEIPFTQEQTEYLAQRDERLITSCGHGFRKGIKHLRNGAVLAFLVLGGGLAGAFYTNGTDRSASDHAIVQSGRVVAVDGCNRDFTTITRVRAVLVNAKKFQLAALKRGDISPERYAEAIAYYDDQLSGLPLPDCRNATTIITNDPNRPKPIPDPKYPADAPPTGYNGPH